MIGDRDATMRLPDGRRLGWATYGAVDGAGVVAVHGSPDSRGIWALFDDAAARHGLRLFCPDRAGFGLTEASPRDPVLGWVDDLDALVDHLGLQRFPLLAISGGGAYACAAASKLPDRISGLGLLSVIGPMDGRTRQRG